MATQKRTQTERVLDCIEEMHGDFIGNGVMNPVTEYMDVHNVPRSLGAVLQKRGIIERVSKREYIWKGEDPDSKMALTLIQDIKARALEQKHERKNIKTIADKTPIDDIVNELMAYLDMAMEYDIPQEKWNKYMKDMFHKHHGKD